MPKIFLASLIALTIIPVSWYPVEAADKPIPVITESFASKTVQVGETWKIYLKASDPDGRMKRIYASIDQPGVSPYPLTIISLPKEKGKELSGYIYLSTANPNIPLNSVNLTLSVQVQDESGNFSEPAVFELSIQSHSSQQTPPPGVFREEELGPVTVKLRPGRSRND